jgi:hypothetical protein
VKEPTRHSAQGWLTVARMSAPAPLDTPDVDLDIDLDVLFSGSDDFLHVECCSKEAFLCGHPHHPELAANAPAAEDVACEDCLDEIVKGRCPAHAPTHFHCPLVLRESGLFTFCDGPGRR